MIPIGKYLEAWGLGLLPLNCQRCGFVPKPFSPTLNVTLSRYLNLLSGGFYGIWLVTENFIDQQHY